MSALSVYATEAGPAVVKVGFHLSDPPEVMVLKRFCIRRTSKRVSPCAAASEKDSVMTSSLILKREGRTVCPTMDYLRKSG